MPRVAHTIRALALAALLAALAGCGAAASTGTNTGSTPPPASAGCAYQATSADGALMTVQASRTDCGQLLQFLATGGQVWSPDADPAASVTSYGSTYPAVTVCSLSQGGAAVTVRQAGSTGVYLESQGICSALEQSGWTP